MMPSQLPMKPDEEKLTRIGFGTTVWWVLHAVADWAIIFAAYFVAFSVHTWWMYIIAILVIGNRQHALSILGHDGAHYLVSKHKGVNDLLTNILTFWALDANVGRYRTFHIEHHKYLGSALDPELIAKGKQKPLWDTPITWRRMALQGIRDLCGLQIREQFAFLKMITPPISRVDAVGHLVFYGVVGTTLFYFNILIPVLVIWFIAEATSFWIIFRFRMYTEHVGTESAYRFMAPWWARMLFLPHNTWYHYEHHHNFSVPFFRLPKVRKLYPGTPVDTLTAVFKKISEAPPIPSGTPLRNLPQDGSVTVTL